MAITKEFAHELDVAWIISLWLAIHGGDPPPDERLTLSEREAVAIARQAANALVGYIAAVAAGGAEVPSAEVHEQFSQQVKAAGLKLLSLQEPHINQPRPYCFTWNGRTICVPLPRLTHLP